MTEFNYLVHGSVIFAAGLLIGLIGALISTHGTRRELKRLRKQVVELENTRSEPSTLDTPAQAPAPRMAATPVATPIESAPANKPTAQSVGTAATAAAAVVGSSAVTALSANEPQQTRVSQDVQRDDIAADAVDEPFDHTRVKTAVPNDAANEVAAAPEKTGNQPPLSTVATAEQPEAADEPAVKSPVPVPAAQTASSTERPKISLNSPPPRGDDKPLTVDVPPRKDPSEKFAVPRLTPSTAVSGLAAGGAAAGIPDLNLNVNRPDDHDGRIEPSLGLRGAQDSQSSSEDPSESSVENAEDAQRDTIWDNPQGSSGNTPDNSAHNSADARDDGFVRTQDRTTDSNELPPINEDGTVGFQDSSSPTADTDGELDEDSKKRSLRKALLTGGTLLGVDND